MQCHCCPIADSVCCSLYRKDEEVQSNCCGIMRLNREGGIDAVTCDASGRTVKNCLTWFLESKSAASLLTPAICVAVRSMSNITVKNHKQWRRCITKVSFVEPLLMATTKLWLSH